MVLEEEFPTDDRVEKDVLSHIKHICFLKSKANIRL